VVKVQVVQDKCQGHSRCYALAPELFDVDDFGQAHERHGGAVPVGSEPAARLAAANCPEFAIEIED
jgi:ferredoxin